MRAFVLVFLLLACFCGYGRTDSLPQKQAGMTYVPGGTFIMGAADDEAGPDEFPPHRVTLSGFWMDTTEVTNQSFAAFVSATGYITVAERPSANSREQPGAMVFQPESGWQWTARASWRHPSGPGSDLSGKDLHPVVHITWEDANAYCTWTGKRLPTEAEWEYAARGGMKEAPYPWGSQSPATGPAKANIWEGDFPLRNTTADGYVFTAPVAQYAPNGYGLYDMAGNVWEWCSDWYDAGYYHQFRDSMAINPRGPALPASDKVIRGGSFLCHHTYCSGYRVSRRMYTPPGNAIMHTGFRCVKDDKR